MGRSSNLIDYFYTNPLYQCIGWLMRTLIAEYCNNNYVWPIIKKKKDTLIQQKSSGCNKCNGDNGLLRFCPFRTTKG